MRKSPLVLGLVLLVCLLASPKAVQADSTETLLPIGLTEEEKGRLHEIGKNHTVTKAPTGVLRNPAEWEPSEGVIIRWPLGISVALVREMSEDLMVTTIVANSSEQASATSAYQSGGVVMANTQFLIASTNSIWTRDYGPWFIFSDEALGIVDHIYNRPRPLDDLIPGILGSQWGIPVYGMDLIHTGGNHMSDGLGRSMSTRLVYNENSGKTPAQVDSIMLAYLGNDYTVLDYIESGGIHHIDCWAKFLSPTTIMVKDVPVGDYSYELLNDRAEYLSQQVSAWGQPYTIVRVYCPYGTAYTNSIILNDKVLVPIFGSGYDNIALQTYRDAMPGYEVIGFTGSWYDDDAVHCRTMGVPDRYMLRVHHVPLVRVADSLAGYEISALIHACSGAALIGDSLKVVYRVGEGEWESALLSAGTETDWFDGTLPPQASGAEVSYYVQAADLSGRMETHPYIGAPGAHRFSVNITPTIVADSSILCTGGTTIAFCPDIVDGEDSSHTITYANYPAWLSPSGDSLTGTVPMGMTSTGSFDVVVSDAYNSAAQTVALDVILCGDVNDDAIGPDLSDLIYLVNYLFLSGPAPNSATASNVDGVGGVDLSDLIYLVNLLFMGGPPATCGL
ncbi:MAG: agmatine deiminase family protein [candidate division Zixibacteria bacterium]|jgi:agmatine/peptidylarginine deiminase|nr:agmatine deiminase family protein [candidate division Zixibacteria bacterium]